MGFPSCRLQEMVLHTKSRAAQPLLRIACDCRLEAIGVPKKARVLTAPRLHTFPKNLQLSDEDINLYSLEDVYKHLHLASEVVLTVRDRPSVQSYEFCSAQELEQMVACLVPNRDLVCVDEDRYAKDATRRPLVLSLFLCGVPFGVRLCGRSCPESCPWCAHTLQMLIRFRPPLLPFTGSLTTRHGSSPRTNPSPRWTGRLCWA